MTPIKPTENRHMTTLQGVSRRFAMCLPLAVLGACAAGNAPKPVVVLPVLQAPGKAYVTASDDTDGASVLLDATQELHVELSLSSYEVANNMDWSLVGLTSGVLTMLGSRFERAGRDSNPSESGGSTIFLLKAAAPGRVALGFELRRAYSRGEPTRVARFDVTVR